MALPYRRDRQKWRAADGRTPIAFPEPGGEPDLWLVFAPIKRTRLDWLVEKATELGVSALLPVWTVRTQVERVNLERLRAHAIEAAEQSERVSVPEIRAPEPLDRLLASWPAGAPAHRVRREWRR